MCYTQPYTHARIYLMKQFMSMAFEFAAHSSFPQCFSPPLKPEENAPWKALDKAL